MPGIGDLLYGVLLPATVCGALLAWVWSSRVAGVDASVARRQLQALALAGGFLVAYCAIAGTPVLPSANRRLAALDWLPWIVIAVAIASAVQATRAGQRIPRIVWSAFLCALVPVLSFLSQFTDGPPWRALLGCTLVLFVVWQSTDALARKITGPGIPSVLLVVATGTSVAALLSSSAKIAQLAGGLAACLGACVVVGLWNPLLSLAGGGVAVAIAVLGACWINAVHYASLPPQAGVLLVAALLTPWLARLWRIEESSRTRQALVCAALAAVPTTAAVVIAHLAAPDPYS